MRDKPSVSRLVEAYMCAYTHTHTCTRRRAGARERKGIVNRKHAGLARDWEVILDHWPLNVFCFCFTLKFLREAFAFHIKAITMQGIMGDWHWAFRPSLECFFSPFFSSELFSGGEWYRGKSGMNVSASEELVLSRSVKFWQVRKPFTCEYSQVFGHRYSLQCVR